MSKKILLIGYDKLFTEKISEILSADFPGVQVDVYYNWTNALAGSNKNKYSAVIFDKGPATGITNAGSIRMVKKITGAPVIFMSSSFVKEEKDSADFFLLKSFSLKDLSETIGGILK